MRTYAIFGSLLSLALTAGPWAARAMPHCPGPPSYRRGQQPYHGTTVAVGTDRLCGFGDADKLVRVPRDADPEARYLEDVPFLEEIPADSRQSSDTGADCLHLDRPLDTPGTWVLVSNERNHGRLQVAAEAPDRPAAPPPLDLYSEKRSCTNNKRPYGLFVFRPPNQAAEWLYVWTIRGPGGEIVEQKSGPVPYLLGVDGTGDYRPGRSYEVRIEILFPDGTTSSTATREMTFRYTDKNSAASFIHIGSAIEALIPDLRVEYDDHLELTLSLPVGATLWESFRIKSCTLCGRLGAFAEPQISLGSGTPRIFGSLRAQLGIPVSDHPDVFVSADAGYLYGGDGHGPGVGLGVGLGEFGYTGIQLVARRYHLGDRPARYDVAIDLEWFPLAGLL